MNEVKQLIQVASHKNQRYIGMALIKQLSDYYPFSTNGVYLLISKMGAGKSYWIWLHIMITERLFTHRYYSKIIFCSTSGKLDKTAEVISKNVKTPITCIKERAFITISQASPQT